MINSYKWKTEENVDLLYRWHSRANSIILVEKKDMCHYPLRRGWETAKYLFGLDLSTMQRSSFVQKCLCLMFQLFFSNR